MDRGIEAGLRFLRGARNDDGAWPYRTGAMSYPEPTAYALLALAGDREEQGAALDWFRNRVDDGGALRLADDDEPNWAVSLLVLALARLKGDPSLLSRCVAWLLESKGNRVEAAGAGINELDGRLIGWPWATDTFSWVEPTSYALIALKAAGERAHARVAEGERLLIDRVCVGGGWNYGNRIVMGEKLVAFLPTTALALLALRGAPGSEAVITEGLDFAGKEIAQQRSTLSLALVTMCFEAFRRPLSDLADALRARQSADGSWRSSPQLTALSILALRCAAGEGNVFRV